MRIVSLTCSNTEIVCAIGCGHMLVGIDDYSDYPTEITSCIPRVGRDLNIDTNKVAKLEPDLVLASLTVPGHENVVVNLEKAGLPYMVTEPIRLNDVYGDVIAIGDRLNAIEQAERVVEEMRLIVEPIKTADRPPSVLIQWWPKPVIAPGKLSWTEDLVQAAGMFNPIGNRDVKSCPLTDKEVCEFNPDAVVISWCGVSKNRPHIVYRNPLWQDTKFVENKNVHVIPEAYLGRPSPRLVEGYRELVKLSEKLSKSA